MSGHADSSYGRVRSLRTGALYLVLSVSLLPASCSLFDPRAPEDPDESPQFWQYPSVPSIVISNLDGSLENQSITLYMTCFDTTFAFLADPADTIEYGGALEFGNWDYEVEQNTLINLFAQVQGTGAPAESLVSVTFTTVSGQPDPPAPVDSVTIWRDYSIVVAGSGYATWENPARGRAVITMVESSSATWSVRRWEDYRPDDYTGDSYTWGVTKADYR
jgi:hypothetical protein